MDDVEDAGRWLAGIARNLHRKHLRRPRLVDLEDVDDVSAEEQRPLDERARVRAAIDRLPPPEREVVRMFYLEQTSTRQVAALLGTSERAVEGKLRRARQRLEGWLEPREESIA